MEKEISILFDHDFKTGTFYFLPQIPMINYPLKNNALVMFAI